MIGRYLMLGSSGFLGSSLKKSLTDSGQAVIELPRDFLDNSQGARELTSARIPTTLISMAWSSNAYTGYQNDEINFVWRDRHRRIVDWCLMNNVRCVIPGTCLEYLENSESLYVKAKRQLLKHIQETLAVQNYLWVRYFYVFSLSAARPRVIRSALDSKSADNPFLVRNPTMSHDYVELNDAINQSMALILSNSCGVHDVGSGILRSNRLLLSKIPGIRIIESTGIVPTPHGDYWCQPSQSALLSDPNMSKYTRRYFDD